MIFKFFNMTFIAHGFILQKDILSKCILYMKHVPYHILFSSIDFTQHTLFWVCTFQCVLVCHFLFFINLLACVWHSIFYHGCLCIKKKKAQHTEGWVRYEVPGISFKCWQLIPHRLWPRISLLCPLLHHPLLRKKWFQLEMEAEWL